MNSRSSGKALWCAECAFANARKPAVSLYRRTFTNTPSRPRHGAVPAFTDLSNGELTRILTLLRERTILPAHLSKTQRDLMYRTRNHKQLLAEDLSARIAGEEFPLRPIDPKVDVPNARKTLLRAIDLMETKSDWDNLPRILQGLKQAGIHLEPWIYDKIARKAGQAGRQSIILECARQGTSTGFLLNDPELVRQAVWWFQKMAVDNDFDQSSTEKALKWTEAIFDLMEDPKHSPKAGSPDPRNQPEIVGVLLQLAAVRASKYLNGQDQDGKVEKYTAHLLPLLTEPGLPKAEPRGGTLNFWLAKVVPLLHGMKVALEVLEPSSKIAQALKTKAVQVDSDISRESETMWADALLSESTPVGVELYQKLIRQAP